jgi:hypothetical protein
MNRVLYLAAIALLISCGNKSKQNDSTNSTDSSNTNSNIIQSNYNPDSLKGEYIGGFGNNTIIIAINYINGKNASGYNILKGNRRNIKGDVENMGDHFKFNLSEPGGDPFDGIFHFNIDTTTLSLEGTWTPYDSVKIKPRKYKLNKRMFKHEDMVGPIGMWYLNDLTVQFKPDKTGEARGYWYNEKTATSEQVEIPFSWFDEKKAVSIEWGRNNIFLSSKMKFSYEKNEYEEMLQSGDYIMYRY